LKSTVLLIHRGWIQLMLLIHYSWIHLFLPTHHGWIQLFYLHITVELNCVLLTYYSWIQLILLTPGLSSAVFTYIKRFNSTVFTNTILLNSTVLLTHHGWTRRFLLPDDGKLILPKRLDVVQWQSWSRVHAVGQTRCTVLTTARHRARVVSMFVAYSLVQCRPDDSASIPGGDKEFFCSSPRNHRGGNAAGVWRWLSNGEVQNEASTRIHGASLRFVDFYQRHRLCTRG
jgi:hypothetical protein